MPIDVNAVQSWLAANARPLDLALYDFHVNRGNAVAIVGALRPFQNADGGFGHGLEPDLGMPDSSALATSVAFQYLVAAGVGPDEPIVAHAMAYLTATYSPATSGWAIICRAADNHPHAPWWQYEQAMAGFGWGNPSAELLSYLYRYARSSPAADLIVSTTKRALERLEHLTTEQEADFHELLCFVGLSEAVDRSLRSTMRDLLMPLITRAVSTNPDDWGEYGATPLTFASSPTSPFADLFARDQIELNLDLVESAIVSDHWEPTWDWGGAYPGAWAEARLAWSGKMTVDAMLTLRAYGRIGA